MKLPKLEIKDTSDVATVDELLKHIEKIVDYVQMLTKELEDVLENLSSDNIAEIDFGRTRVMSDQLATIDWVDGMGFAQQTWVTDNFVSK